MRKIFVILSIITICFAFLDKAEHISATTVDDVIAHAYEVGLPEEKIQECINIYGSGQYSSEQCQKAIDILDSFAEQRDNAILKGNESESSVSETEDYISEDAFNQLDVDEKREYMNQIPEEKKQEYLEFMSNDEKNQILKELDISSQVDVISKVAEMGTAFDYNFSIEKISEGEIVISTKDMSGNIVSVSTLGNTIEDTGVSYLIPVTIGLFFIAVSLSGMILLIKSAGVK
jgi:hypothetical protein